MKKILYILITLILVSSCGISTHTRGSQYPLMYEEKPAMLLVMPPINRTTKVEAKELLYTSISRPLIEAGYYVISPHLAMDIFKAESAYNAENFFDGKLDIFKNYFGVDAVVFSFVEKWNKGISSISTTIRYVIKSAHTGEILFDRTCELDLDTSVDAGSDTLLDALVSVAGTLLNTALTDHIEAARKANYYIFQDIPRGRFSPEHMQDYDFPADPKNIREIVKY